MYSSQKQAVAAKPAADAPKPARPLAHLKAPSAVLDAIGTRVHAARRSARRKLFAAEDVFDAAVIQLRRHPLRSLGVTLAAGLALGMVAGRLVFKRLGRD
jgi:hypothetical protein